jgi:ABC-type multidrug transport system ATPase subunit
MSGQADTRPAAGERSVVLEADSIGKTFGRRRILTAASVRVFAGCVTALLGRNGCGKSTLLRTMIGFTRADWGSVHCNGRRVERPALHRLARHGVFYIPERNLLTRTHTVARHFASLQRTFPAAVVRTAIEHFRIGDLLDRLPRQLSTGERRRVEIALAFAREPRCLLADELFLGLAPRDAETIAAAVRDFAKRGCGVLVTGHEVDSLLAIADAVVWMVAGTTHSLGPPEAALLHDQFRREYLGPRHRPGGAASATAL